MYTVGHTYQCPPIHAGGLRYHGKAPSLSLLIRKGIITSRSYMQNEVMEAGMTFSKVEGIVPAPETCHAVKAAIDEAIKCKKTGEKKVILFNFSGHGLLDLGAYDDFMAKKLLDYEARPEELQRSMADIPKISA
jgi:tryptophan synthase beta chain